MPTVKLLRLAGVPILRQLHLEEALLRADSANWCLLNVGTSVPTIVMGVSGKTEELMHVPETRRAGVTVVKRFSGGGTVVVDMDTVFATLIFNADALPDVECYPRPIMRWSESFYAPIFAPHGDFRLREHDYVFGERKFGGNAQAITRRRWLHHTSVLWDFDDARMRLLKHPARAPEYRAGRDHLEFVCRLKEVLPDREAFVDAIAARVAECGFDLEEATLEEAEERLQREYIRNVQVVQLF